MATIERTASVRDLSPARPNVHGVPVVIAALMLAVSLAALDATIVGAALPRIAADLHGLNQLSWVVTAFLLAQSAGMPLYGKLSDTYGRKPLLLIATAIFLAGSCLCGLASNMGQVVAFRAIQGLGAGGIVPMASAMMADIVGPRDRGKYQGLFTAVFTVSNLAGPFAGGLLTTAFGWRWVFLINLPFGAVALPLLAAILPRGGARVRHAIDYLGALLLVAFTVTLLGAVSGGGTVYPWLSLQAAGLVAAVLALFGLLLWRESVAAEPVLPLGLFRDPTVACCMAVGGLIALPYFGGVVFLPLYFQLVLGMSPAMGGLMTTPQMIGVLAASVVCGAAVSRSGRYRGVIVGGLVLVAVGMAAVGAAAWFEAPPWTYPVALTVIGVGGGASMPNLTVAVQNAAHRSQTGSATSILAFVNTLCGACGVAASGAIMVNGLEAYVQRRLPNVNARALLQGGLRPTAGLGPHAHAVVVEGYRQAIALTFLVGAVLMAGALAASLLIPNKVLHKAAARPGMEPDDGGAAVPIL